MMKLIGISIIGMLAFVVLNAEQTDQKDAQMYLKKSIKLIQKEQFDKALSIIRKAKELDEKNPEVYRLEAQLLEILGQRDKALNAWELCLQFAESEKLIEEAKIHINHLKD